MHVNNIPDNSEMGVYALLMRRNDGKIKGVKYSILYQYEEHSPMLIYSDAKVEAYILFYADYDDIIGPWDYHSVSRQECAELYGKENHFPPELAYYDGLRFQMVIFITSADFSAHSKVWKKLKHMRCIMRM